MSKWLAFRTEEGSEVVPLDDVVGHEDGDDCPCLPSVEYVKANDGGDAWMVSHNAWDGRI